MAWRTGVALAGLTWVLGAVTACAETPLPTAVIAHPVAPGALPSGPTVNGSVPSGPAGPPAAAMAMQRADIDRGAAALRADLAHEVPQRLTWPAARQAAWIGRTRAAIAAQGASLGAVPLDGAQLLVVVDRNPAVQEMALVLARPDMEWQVLGGSKVSTGQAGRKDYYITPTGVFAHTDAILDFRAQGTFNENHIRGLGLEGMRVWDFGWNWAVKGWRADAEGGDIRLQMHATDPDYLEQRLGRPASEGCVRVPASMNRFLDRHGILDADYERAAVEDVRYRALLRPDRTPTPLAGRLMVVIDTREPADLPPTAASRPPPTEPDETSALSLADGGVK